jgi:hypothetical protein
VREAVVPQREPDLFGAYDPDSIMSYCSPPTAAPWLSTNARSKARTAQRRTRRPPRDAANDSPAKKMVPDTPGYLGNLLTRKTKRKSASVA